MKAVFYARYSSDGQREESIEGQLRECKEYAEKNNITVLGTYIDRALSEIESAGVGSSLSCLSAPRKVLILGAF
jgi:DNA invertase Pin-like site-specific DNA recombinase